RNPLRDAQGELSLASRELRARCERPSYSRAAGAQISCGELPAPMERRRELLLVGRGQEPAPVEGCGRRLMRCCAVRSRVRTALLPLPFLSHQGHQTLRFVVQAGPGRFRHGASAGRRCCGLDVCAVILGWALGADLIDDGSALTDQPLTRAVERL